MDTRQSKCLLCPLGCDVAFRVKGEAVVGPEFCAAAGPHSARVCARGLYGADLLMHPQRVANPFVRKDGVLRDASWESAVEALGSSLRRIADAHGWKSVAVVTEPTRSTAELEAVDRFARSLGVGAVSCLFEPQDWPLVAAEDSDGVSAITEANCVIVLGDPFFSHAVLAKDIIDAKYTARGNSLFVVDPRKSNTAWYASEHVQNRPGSEALVLACMLKALQASGKIGSGTLPWLDAVDETSLLAAAGIGRDVVARMARAYADGAKAAIVVAPAARAVYDVALVARLARLIAGSCGDGKGCVLLPSGGNVLGAREAVSKGGWTSAPALVHGLAAGKYKALLNLGADVLCSFPSPALTAAVRGLECVASLSLFRGEIESASSVVLAGASWLESDGSAVLFDGTKSTWSAVGGPSWGCRTLTDVLALLEKSVGKPAAGGAASSGSAGQSLPTVSDDTIAERLSAVKEAMSADAGDRLATVTLPATGHSGCGAVTNWMQWAREMFPTGFCEISVEDAASRGIAEKDTVVVESTGIGVELKARITDRLKAGVLGVPGYDARARALFSWESGSDGWFSTGPGHVRVRRKQ